MTSGSRRLVAVLLLAAYGLISACGVGLHALADGWRVGEIPSACSGGEHHSSPPSEADHDDCLICHVIGQEQALVAAAPGLSDVVVGDEPPAPSTPRLAPPPRLRGEPRAPPRSRS